MTNGGFFDMLGNLGREEIPRAIDDARRRVRDILTRDEMRDARRGIFAVERELDRLISDLSKVQREIPSDRMSHRRIQEARDTLRTMVDDLDRIQDDLDDVRDLGDTINRKLLDAEQRFRGG